jgi:hypothetical protein
MKRRRKKILGLPIGPQQPSVAERLVRPAIAVAGLGAAGLAASRIRRRTNGGPPAAPRSSARNHFGRTSRPSTDPSNEARSVRADAQRRLKAGDLSLEGVLRRADEDDAIARTRVKVLLQNLPGVGARGAVTAMEELGIAPNRRVGGLGSRQRDELLERFAGAGRSSR